jgi:L-threonylcarbamoyladenylate synthase
MPEIIKIDLNDATIFRSQMVKIKRVLNLGGVMAFPTDTFYGLGATPFNREAVARIFKIKQRAKDKPLLTLVASAYQTNIMAREIIPTAEILTDKLWPGPLTILFSARPDLPSQLTAGSGKIGVRQPANEMVCKLLSGIGFPITATSANISGGENITTALEAEKVLGDQVDLIVDGGPTPGGKESTVLDVTLSPPLLVREGAVSREEIDAVLETPCIAVP